MPHSFGYRNRTRDLFSKAFRKHGPTNLSKYLVSYRRGDFVDIVADPSHQGGMPHKFYHGKTGKVFDVTPRSVGVIVNKIIGHRQLKKRIHVRIEHVQKSRCREDFLNRVRENDKRKTEARKKGETLSTKRIPGLPKPGRVVKTGETKVTFQHPPIFREVF
mmetsp:Transcript_60597/g.69157  ORF Transcript_60597/g.69157 Transcript_60597/m.69157 type:complete len:161 (+) Transcript_60597:89-571(+)